MDQALGYDSWADYAAAEFGPHTQSLAAPIRRELVSKLTDTGLSTRAISAATGKSIGTTFNDIHAGVQKMNTSVAEESYSDDFDLAAPVAPVPSTPAVEVHNPVDMDYGDIEEPVDPVTGEINDEPEAEPAPKTITGLDGKRYTVPQRQPAKPRREPLTDSFTHQTVKLNSLVDSFTRLIEDDRFDTNKQNIATVNGSDIKRAIDALSKVFDALNNK